MTPLSAREILTALRELAQQQLEASRRGDLDTLEALEARRRELVAAFDAQELAALMDERPAAVAADLEALRASERLVRSRLQGRLAQLTRALEQAESRDRAQQRYLKTP